MNENMTSSGTLKRITGLVKLESSRFRKAFLTLVAIAVAFLLIAGQALGLPPIDGLATAAIVTVVLVSLMLDYIIQWVGPAAMEVYRDDKNTALDRQIDFVKNKKPAFVKLCEYSTATIEELLQALADCDRLKKLDLLICDPATALTDLQGDRILNSIMRLPRTFTLPVLARFDHVEIRCYGSQARMRGRNFGDQLIAMGWYTFDRRPELDRRKMPQIWGDKNATVVVPCSEESGVSLRDMYNQVFDNMWRDALPLAQAISPDRVTYNKSLEEALPEPEWLEKVSGGQQKPGDVPETTAGVSGDVR